MKNFYCDGFCKRCFKKEKCKIFDEKFEYEIKCIMKGKDPYDPQMIAETIKERIKLIFGSFEKESEQKEKNKVFSEIEELFKKIRAVNYSLAGLIIKIINLSTSSKNQFFSAVLQDDLENLLHYHNLLEIKSFDLLRRERNHSFLKNTAIIYFSIIVCQKSILNFLAGLGQFCSIDCLFLLEQIDQFKIELLKKFPDILNYKDKIIFNTLV